MASRITVYALSKALAISPLEVYKMPKDLVTDMLLIHANFERLQGEEMDKKMKQVPSAPSKFR